MPYQKSREPHRRLGGLLLGALAVLGAPAVGAAQHEGHGGSQAAAEPVHQHPAGADEAETPRVGIDFAVLSGGKPLGAAGAIEHEEIELRVRLTDPETGRPVTGLSPMAWIDVRTGADFTKPEQCRQRVGAFTEGMLNVRHGQGYSAQPVDDLTDHYLLALSRGPNILVIDPVRGFGRTRLFTTVLLESPGEDWVESPDGNRLFVSLPRVGKVAVVSTHRWKVEETVTTGARPTRLVFQPDQRYLWTLAEAAGSDPAGVVVIDPASLKVAARIPTGEGPHAIAFSSDGKLAFVANRTAGTVSVIDAARLAKLKDVPTGSQPTDVAHSSRTGKAYVTHEEDGSVAVLDVESLAVEERISFRPGTRSFRIAPERSAAQGGHHEAAPATDGRFAFVLNPREGTVDVYDVVARKQLRTLSLGRAPDQVGFTGSFAYIRSAGTAEVVMIPLHNPLEGGDRPHDRFAAGSAAPGAVGEKGLGQLIVPMPHMGDGVYVANPEERMIYSYHYMEGMPVPHKGLTTYGFDIKAVRTSSRRMREVEPGTYAATVRMDRRGNYDLVLRVQEPHVLDCLGFSVRPDPARLASGVDIQPTSGVRTLRVGENRLSFRVLGAAKQEPLTGVEDLHLRIASPGGWQYRVQLRPAEDGTYAADLNVEEAGVYYLAFASPSLGIQWRDRSPLVVQAVNEP